MCRPKLIFDGCHNLELRDRNLEKSSESNKSVDVVQYFRDIDHQQVSTVRLAVLTQHRCVTDGRTDGQNSYIN